MTIRALLQVLCYFLALPCRCCFAGIIWSILSYNGVPLTPQQLVDLLNPNSTFKDGNVTLPEIPVAGSAEEAVDFDLTMDTTDKAPSASSAPPPAAAIPVVPAATRTTTATTKSVFERAAEAAADSHIKSLGVDDRDWEFIKKAGGVFVQHTKAIFEDAFAESGAERGWQVLAKVLDRYISCIMPAASDVEPEFARPTAARSQTHASLRPAEYHEPGSAEFIEDLVGLLLSVQLHDPDHKPSCNKDGTGVCRFGFPKALQIATVIALVYNKKRGYAEVKPLHARNNCYLNNYNQWVAVHARANMDIQFLVSAVGAAVYACWYSSKAESPDFNIFTRDMLHMLAREQKAGVSIHDMTKRKLFCAGMSLLQAHQTGLQQVCWYLLGLPLVICNVPVVEVNVLPPSMRLRPLKPVSQLSKLPPTSTDIFRGDAAAAGDDAAEPLPPAQAAPEILQFMGLSPVQLQLKTTSAYDFITQYSASRCKSLLPGEKGLVGIDDRVYKKRKLRRVLTTSPYVDPDPETQLGAWSLLVLHRSHYSSLDELGDPADAVATLQREREAGNLCNSYDRCMSRYTAQRQTMQTIREHGADPSISAAVSVLATEAEKERTQQAAYNAENKAADDFFGAPAESEGDHNPFRADGQSAVLDDENNPMPGVHVIHGTAFTAAAKFLSRVTGSAATKLEEELREYAEADYSKNGAPKIDEIGAVHAGLLRALRAEYAILNAGQRDAFHVIVAHFTDQPCCKTPSNPSGRLRFLLSGAGGVGKSRLLKAIVLFARLHFGHSVGSESARVSVSSTTIRSAANIRGHTVDSALHTSALTHPKNQNKGGGLTDAAKLRLQASNGDLRAAIVDEVSMMGATKMSLVDGVLRISANNVVEPFGDVHMLFVRFYFFSCSFFCFTFFRCNSMCRLATCTNSDACATTRCGSDPCLTPPTTRSAWLATLLTAQLTALRS